MVTDVVIRSAQLSDAPVIAAVHSAAWREAFTFLPADFLNAMTADAVLATWENLLVESATSMFVAEQDGSVAGFLQVRADADAGEVMALYVDPATWRSGVGSSLLTFAESWLGRRGVTTAILWTARDSQQSRGFYEARGWAASGVDQAQQLGPAGVVLHEVEYRKSVAQRELANPTRRPPGSRRSARMRPRDFSG